MRGKRKIPSPPPPSVFDAGVNELRRLIQDLPGDYRDSWQASLERPSGQHLNVKIPTTNPTEETFMDNRGARDALWEAYDKLRQAEALVRSARGMVSSKRESYDPKRRHSAEGSSLTEREMAEMESRARAKPSQRWERTA